MSTKEDFIKQLDEFRLEYCVSRDKLIEIYVFFKASPQESNYTTLINNAPVTVKRKTFWDVINTTDIRNLCKKNKPQSEIEVSDEEATSTDYTKLRKECVIAKQKLNFERNMFNKKLREISSLEELNKELLNALKRLKPVEVEKNINNNVETIECDDVLVVQLSDLHILELTNELNEQKYDLEVASKRLKKFADTVKDKIVKNGIKKVVIFSTGDIVNSDSIMSKLLNNASNKATGIIMGVILLQHFILDIYSVCNDISYGGICANEGRLHGTDNYYSDENLVSNSPDYIIFNMLNLLFKDINGLKYLQGRSNERVLNINHQNIIFSHGLQLKGDYGKAVASMFARYSTKGINLRFAFTGHLHASKVSNFFARSSSLTGNNSYGSNELNLNSRASQNMATISKNGDINVTPVDLQNIDNISGYDIQKEVQDFCLRKSVTKTNEDIIEVV